MTSNHSPNPNPETEQAASSIPATEPAIEKSTVRSPRVPAWRFWAPLALQSVLIMAIPAQDAYTYATGVQVTLQTVPVDPYDLLRGYSQTLSYEISQLDTLKQLPGAEAVFDANSGDKAIYVVLEAPDTADATPPVPWKPVRVSTNRPTDLPNNQIALKGEYERRRVIYGLETYYMPEDQRNLVNADINQTQGQDPQAFVVEVRIDGQGNSVPVGLWVRDRSYRF